MRSVFRAEESRERLVSRNDIGVDGVHDLLGQTLLVFGRNARRILLGRQQEWIGIDDALTLNRKLLKQESDRHEVVFDSGAKDFRGLTEHARNLVQTGNVILVLLNSIEGHR